MLFCVEKLLHCVDANGRCCFVGFLMSMMSAIRVTFLKLRYRKTLICQSMWIIRWRSSPNNKNETENCFSDHYAEQKTNYLTRKWFKAVAHMTRLRAEVEKDQEECDIY